MNSYSKIDGIKMSPNEHTGSIGSKVASGEIRWGG